MPRPMPAPGCGPSCSPSACGWRWGTWTGPTRSCGWRRWARPATEAGEQAAIWRRSGRSIPAGRPPASGRPASTSPTTSRRRRWSAGEAYARLTGVQLPPGPPLPSPLELVDDRRVELDPDVLLRKVDEAAKELERTAPGRRDAPSTPGRSGGQDARVARSTLRDPGAGSGQILARLDRKVAGGQVTRLLGRERRDLLHATLLGLRASGVEAAARRRVDRRRDVALEDHPLPLGGQVGVGHRYGREQRRHRVAWLAVEAAGVGQLDHLAEVHHRDPVGDVPDHRGGRGR